MDTIPKKQLERLKDWELILLQQAPTTRATKRLAKEILESRKERISKLK